MNQELCNKIGVLGIRRGKALWNGAVLNPDTNKFRGRTGIIVLASIYHTIIKSGIISEGKAQYIICKIDGLEVGFLNVYAPNRGRERAKFWEHICKQLPQASSWSIIGDFNMITNESDRSGNKKLIRGIEQDAWDNLTFKYGLEDSYLNDDFNSQNSLTYTWSNKRDTELQLTRLDRAHVGEWARDRGGKFRILEGFSILSDHLPILLTIRK